MIHDDATQRRESWRHVPSAVERQFGLWSLRAGRTETRPGYNVGPRVITHYNLHVVIGGAVHLRTALADKVQLAAGDVFVLFPEIVHEYWAVAAAPPRMIWVGFDGPAAIPVLTHLGLSPDQPIRRGLEPRRFAALQRQLDTTFADNDTPGSLQPIAYLTDFLAQIAAPTSVPAPLGRRSWLHRARNLLDDHYADGITVGEVAEQVSIDRSHLSKEFAKEFGVGPATYLRDVRLGRAQQLLDETTLSVTEIALSVGYADLYSFSHSYRRRVGRSPSTARER